MIHYYVDPGSGFVFAQNTAAVWGMILGGLGGLLVSFRYFFGFFKRFFWIVVALVALLIVGGFLMHKPPAAKKVIVIGVDAMDPAIVDTLIQNGRLPNLARLKANGAYSLLKTTIPSESAVAWTSFATGSNPGSHGIFDFIMRNPRDYVPYLSLNEISSAGGKTKITVRRKGRTFWTVLSKNKIPAQVYFCPNTFPPEPLVGRMISGMGVPDVSGTMGKFSFYTTQALSDEDRNSRGRVIHVEAPDDVIETRIIGPRVASGESIAESGAPLRITLKPDEKRVFLEFQGKHVSLAEGSWSGWQRVSFKIGLFRAVHGIVRFYLKSVGPEFELYATPVNFDPLKPPFSISYPQNLTSALAKKIGLFHTQGMPIDTWALTEGRIDEKVFLEFADDILNEKKLILTEELKSFTGGLFFFYFDAIDSVQHMFWRYKDPSHPLFEKNPAFEDAIPRYYEQIDGIIGDIVKGMDAHTTLIIISDHGFSSFRRAVHLNRWLLENGYLILKGGDSLGEELFANVNWSKTKAYALGFGGIYINRIGREYYGIVNGSDAQALKGEIMRGLRQLKDPETGDAAVREVYAQEDVFRGQCENSAPDLFVGFNAGYRASWQTALGGTPDVLMEDNRSKWSGDHLIDSHIVPGVIFVNKKTELNDPHIIDIAPTVLEAFDIERPGEMEGKVLF